MKYKGWQLGFLLLTAVTVTAGILLTVHFYIESATVKDFLFERSKVQWITLTVFLFILCMVAHRILYHSQIAFGIRMLSENESWDNPSVLSVLADRCRLIDQCKTEHGNRAAFRYNREQTEDDEAGLERIYGLLGHAMQLLLALGFFGTVWGISQSMSGSFGNLAGATTEELKMGLGSFTSALGTALDTTVLAIICSLIASVLTTVMQWMEKNSLHSVEEAISEHFSLERIFSAEDHECQAAEQLAETIREQTVIAIKSLEEQAEMSRAALISELQQLKADLSHPPEITIRYPSMNGSRNLPRQEVLV